jgi:hypothetical protein
MADLKNEPRNGAREASVARADMKLEAVVIPVSNVDRAKEFYGSLGWRNIRRSAPHAARRNAQAGRSAVDTYEGVTQ